MPDLRLEVLTPEGTVIVKEVDDVILPIPDGWLGILPGRLPFSARLMEGQLLFRIDGKEHRLATVGGTISLKNEKVTVLTGGAILDNDLSGLEETHRERIEAIAADEAEAEKHFNRVYQHMAHSLRHRSGSIA